jgi:type IV pilus assembly protein PilM
MAIQGGVWGIDLGQCALKAIRLEEIDGQVVATAFDYVEHPKILSQPDADPEQLTREALEKFLSRNNLRGDTVAISVPGQSGLARFVKLPPVEEKKITDIVRFEAKQQIPFNLEEVVWDFQKIGSGIVTDGFAMETEIGLFAMKRDMVSRYLGHFKEVNVEVHLVQMAPLALCNYVSYDLLGKNVDGTTAGDQEAAAGKKRCVVALDIGADSSNLVITDGERIIWQRPIPLGGNHFTRALTKDLKLTFAKAEHLKRNATKSPDLKKILAALKPVLNDFVGEVQRSLGYFTNTHRDAQIEYMIGLGNAFRLPGLQRFLAEKLQIEVRKLTKLERLTGNDDVINAPTFTENLASLAVAYGLALQGIKQARLQTNLLPPEIQVERLVRAKKPMAAAAAAALLLGVGALTLGYAMELRAYGSLSGDKSNVVEKAKDDAAVVVDRDKKLTSAWDKLKGEVAKEETEVKSLIAGKDERINWLTLHKFISDCLPRVKEDGDLHMLMTDKKGLYWTADAKFAHDKLQKRLASAKGPLGKDDLDDTYINLAQVNITGFDCRYVAKMDEFLASLKLDPKSLETQEILDSVRSPRPGADRTVKAPESKPGWVVELRGYSYNKHMRNFIIDALIENIARTGGIKEEAAAAAAPAGGATGGGGGGAGATVAADNKEPVKGRVSHVMLYRFLQVPATSPFSLAASGELASLAGGGGGTGGGRGGAADIGANLMTTMKSTPGGGAMPGAAASPQQQVAGGGAGAGAAAGGGAASSSASTSKDFVSLLTARGGSVSSGGGVTAGGAGGPAAGAAAGPGKTLGGLKGVAAVPDSDRTTSAARNKTDSDKGKLQRNEFVVFFFWQEPTPSDPLMDFKQPDPSKTTGGGGGGVGFGGGAGAAMMPGMKGGGAGAAVPK